MSRPLPEPARKEETTRACPVCGREAEDRLKPFCSKRCADVDLGRWLKGGYAIPAEEAPEEDEDGPEGAAGQA